MSVIQMYYELPRYISTPGISFTGGQEKPITSNTVSLNQIPDKLLIMVRKPMSQQIATDTDSYFKINTVSINFNNSSGLLSSSKSNDLYRFSNEAGSNLSFLEFNGSASRPSVSGQAPITFNTTGSLLVLDMGRHVALSEQFFAPGSLGQFSLQVELNVTNNSTQTIVPEIVIIAMNSGVWINERGTSSYFTGLLSKSDVLEASKMEPYTKSDVSRIVGGGFLDQLRGVYNKYLKPLGTPAKKLLQMSDHQYAKTGADVLDSLGFGKSGGLKKRLM